MTKYYAKWTGDYDDQKDYNIYELYTEIGADGIVLREIGFDQKGKVVHKCPSKIDKSIRSMYGLFDLAPIKVPIDNDLSEEQFEQYWQLSEGDHKTDS